MRILHTADIHLREYEDERWETLQKLIEIGKSEKVELFVISGDLFDKDIDAENLRTKIRKTKGTVLRKQRGRFSVSMLVTI